MLKRIAVEVKDLEAEVRKALLEGKVNEVDPLKEVMEKKVRELELKKEYNDWLNNLIEKGIIGRCSVCGEPIAVKEGVCRKHAGKLF